MYNKSFIQACIDGEATVFEIENYIEYWHENNIDVSLREFLGFSEYEYIEWGKNSNSIIRDIIRCRVEGIDFENYKKMTEADRIAARCYDAEKVEQLKKEKNE